MFAFRGVTRKVSTLTEFGSTLAEHPLFAASWAQKLCYYVNSGPCSPNDPEFQRVVGAFRDSDYSWSVLLTELLASPLTTQASQTESADTFGEVVAVARRDHLCAALDSRLGFADVCGLDASSTNIPGQVRVIASGLPSDGYGRGSVEPVLPNSPTMFYRAGVENICAAVSALVIDVATAKQIPNVKQWSSKNPEAAIADFATLLMAIPPKDARSAAATALLHDHFAAAQSGGASAANALKSTFIAACLSPGMTAIGI